MCIRDRFAAIQGISTLPLGISFYTFQTLSYTIDVYRRDVKTEHNIIDFGAYVVMFPQLIAGPIVKYRDVSAQLHVYEHRYSLRQIEEGMTLFTFGLAKKVLLADAVGAVSYTHLRAHETDSYLVCRLLLEKKKNTHQRAHETVATVDRKASFVFKILSATLAILVTSVL